MSTTLEELIDKLLDDDEEFEALGLEALSQEDLLAVLQTLRGHALRLSSLVGELSDQIKIIDIYSKPETSRTYIYIPDPRKRRVIVQ